MRCRIQVFFGGRNGCVFYVFTIHIEFLTDALALLLGTVMIF